MFAWRDAEGVPLTPCTSILPQTSPFGECPLCFTIHLCFWLLQHPVSSCGFQNLVEGFAFCRVSLLHPWREHLIQQLLLFPLPSTLLIDQLFICQFSTQSVTHHKKLLQLCYQHFCKVSPVGGRAFMMASTKIKTHQPV